MRDWSYKSERHLFLGCPIAHPEFLSPIFSLLPKHRVQSLNNNLKAISFSKGQILAIFCSLVSKEKRLSFQTSGITYLEKPPVLKPSSQDGSL